MQCTVEIMVILALNLTACTLQATRSRSTMLEATQQAALDVGTAQAHAEPAVAILADNPPTAAPAASQPLAQRPARRRSLGGGDSCSPVAKTALGLAPFAAPFAAFPKGRRSAVAAVAAVPAAPAAVAPAAVVQHGMPAVPAAAAAAAAAGLPAPPFGPPAGCAVAMAAPRNPVSSAQPTKPPPQQQPLLLQPPLPHLPHLPLGDLSSLPPLQAASLPAMQAASIELPSYGVGSATMPAAIGPLPPPGHAWATAQQLPQPTQQLPPQQSPPLPKQQPAAAEQPLSAGSSSAASWHAELLQMPPDWDGQLPVEAPHATGQPTLLQGGLQGGAEPPLQIERSLTAAVLSTLPEARDPLAEALLPPLPPPDYAVQLAAAAVQFPAVAAAAAAAWGVPWPPAQPQQASQRSSEVAALRWLPRSRSVS